MSSHICFEENDFICKQTKKIFRYPVLVRTNIQNELNLVKGVFYELDYVENERKKLEFSDYKNVPAEYTFCHLFNRGVQSSCITFLF